MLVVQGPLHAICREMHSSARDVTFEHETSFPDDVSCWIVSDGKSGNETQCVGVASALGVTVEVKQVDPRGISRILAPYGPTDRRDRFGLAGSSFAPPWPDLAIACGRLTTPYIRALRRASRLKTYTVILLDPKTGANTADLFWVPQHDKRRGANVITTLTSPHRFSPQHLADLRASPPANIAALPQPRVAVLIGGPNGDYTYDAEDLRRLYAVLREAGAAPVSLMITTSRRTPEAMAAGVEAATRDAPHRILWQGGSDNPYAHFLANADAFLVTADSVNMVGEACATGKPVHVFMPGGSSAKFGRFHASLAAYGATRPITRGAELLNRWSYTPLYSATDIADEIRRRYLRRRAMLGKLIAR
jgi:mitochondrial fission protein ELM1